MKNWRKSYQIGRQPEYRNYNPPLTIKPPHKNTYNQSISSVKRLPITCTPTVWHAGWDRRSLLHHTSGTWPITTAQPLHYPPLPYAIPIDHPWLFSYLANRFSLCANLYKNAGGGQGQNRTGSRCCADQVGSSTKNQ